MRIQKFFKTGVHTEKLLRWKFAYLFKFKRVFFFSFFFLIGLFYCSLIKKRVGSCNCRIPSLDPLMVLYMYSTISWLSSLSCMFKNLWSSPNIWLSDHNQLIIKILSGIFKIPHAPTNQNLIKSLFLTVFLSRK